MDNDKENSITCVDIPLQKNKEIELKNKVLCDDHRSDMKVGGGSGGGRIAHTVWNGV